MKIQNSLFSILIVLGSLNVPANELGQNFPRPYSSNLDRLSYTDSLYPYNVDIEKDIPQFRDLTCTQILEELMKMRGFDPSSFDEKKLSEEQKRSLVVHGLASAGLFVINPFFGVASLLAGGMIRSDLSKHVPKTSMVSYLIMKSAYLENDTEWILKYQKDLKKKFKIVATTQELKEFLRQEDRLKDVCFQEYNSSRPEPVFYFFFPYYRDLPYYSKHGVRW